MSILRTVTIFGALRLSALFPQGALDISTNQSGQGSDVSTPQALAPFFLDYYSDDDRNMREFDSVGCLLAYERSPNPRDLSTENKDQDCVHNTSHAKAESQSYLCFFFMYAAGQCSREIYRHEMESSETDELPTQPTKNNH